jgi:predicted regulator of Ras-like GTPase activity (Roadblock/LC7/MglB family)
VKEILRELNETLAARGSIVVAPDGVLVASDVDEAADLERLAAMGAALLTGVGRALTASGMDALAQVEIAAERGKVILVEAGPTYLMVLLGARLEIGPASLEIRSAAQRIARAAQLATT